MLFVELHVATGDSTPLTESDISEQLYPNHCVFCCVSGRVANEQACMQLGYGLTTSPLRTVLAASRPADGAILSLTTVAAAEILSCDC